MSVPGRPSRRCPPGGHGRAGSSGFRSPPERFATVPLVSSDTKPSTWATARVATTGAQTVRTRRRGQSSVPPRSQDRERSAANASTVPPPVPLDSRFSGAGVYTSREHPGIAGRVPPTGPLSRKYVFPTSTPGVTASKPGSRDTGLDGRRLAAPDSPFYCYLCVYDHNDGLLVPQTQYKVQFRRERRCHGHK